MKKAIIIGLVLLSIIGIAIAGLTQDVEEEIVIENIESDNKPKEYTVGLSESIGISHGNP